MSTPTIHQRWDAKNNRRVGVPIDSARLIPSPYTCPLATPQHFISPSAPTTAGLHAPWQQTPTRIPGVCNTCERVLLANEAHSSSTGGAASVLAFSLSDACPDIGGAHGYVDLLKRVTIPPADWPPFSLALQTAGIFDPARSLSVRDRTLAYVLWNAAMAPPDHGGLGLAPGVRDDGATILFLDMLDPARGVVEVDFWDFVRVLQEVVAGDAAFWQERAERLRIRRMVRKVNRSRLRENNAGQENVAGQENAPPSPYPPSSDGEDEDDEEEELENRDTSSPAPTTVPSKPTDLATVPPPPFDPPYERAHWCIRAGLRPETWYREPEGLSQLQLVAQECARVKGLPVPDFTDAGCGGEVPETGENVAEPVYQGKGKGRACGDGDAADEGRANVEAVVDTADTANHMDKGKSRASPPPLAPEPTVNPTTIDKGKGRADALPSPASRSPSIADWIFIDNPCVEWSTASAPPFYLDGQPYRFPPPGANQTRSQNEGGRGREKRPWVVRASRRIVRGVFGEKEKGEEKEERRGKGLGLGFGMGMGSKVSAEWNRRKVAMGRSFAGRWGSVA
ncbi:uncharacterized protein BKA78DRAFT_349388 [Phyllosticta capitalensis]|uniref:uncharacterized protein n=1 Tax=Phyllosticta capitalensis TaxID=121624 RepID=UPI00312F146F